jgi:hypothetical protein
MEWVAQPGQYIQLWMPRLGLRSSLQLLAFYVASVDTVLNAPGAPTTRILRMSPDPDRASNKFNGFRHKALRATNVECELTLKVSWGLPKLNVLEQIRRTSGQRHVCEHFRTGDNL